MIEYRSDSGWGVAAPSPAELPAGSLTADVVVVGGGYTGMSAALRLRERGLDTVLLEARHCGWGASSRNAGHLGPTIGGDPQLLATAYRRRAAELVPLAERAVRSTEALIASTAIDCEYEPVGNVSAALTAGGARRAERIASFLARQGADVEFAGGSGSGLPETMPGGIVERTGGLLNPGRFAAGLRERLLASGARVHEGAAALSVERAAGGFSVRTAAAEVRSSHVLVATNAFSLQVPFLPPRIVRPLWVTLLETEPIDPERLAATGWTRAAGIYTQHLILESYRRSARGTLVFGTRQVSPPRGGVVERLPERRVVEDVARGLRERLPSLFRSGEGPRIQRAWGGWIAMTPSWLPVAGVTREGLHYAVGYNGHGLAQAPYLGGLIADHIAGGDRHDDLELLWHRSQRHLPAPLFSGGALKLAWALDRLGDRLAAGP